MLAPGQQQDGADALRTLGSRTLSRPRGNTVSIGAKRDPRQPAALLGLLVKCRRVADVQPLANAVSGARRS